MEYSLYLYSHVSVNDALETDATTPQRADCLSRQALRRKTMAHGRLHRLLRQDGK